MSRKAEARDPNELRIVLIGKVGAGKTSSMNTLLGRPQGDRYVATSTMWKGTSEDPKMVLVDTPGLSSLRKEYKNMLKKITNTTFKSGSSIDPHVFLYVLKDNFDVHDVKRVNKLKKILGEKSPPYIFFLFTCVDKKMSSADKKKMEDFLREVEFEPNNYCVIDNRGENAKEHVKELMDEVTEKVKENKHQCYTEEMFNEAKQNSCYKVSSCLKNSGYFVKKIIKRLMLQSKKIKTPL